jgi:hypothetical protein
MTRNEISKLNSRINKKYPNMIVTRRKLNKEDYELLGDHSNNCEDMHLPFCHLVVYQKYCFLWIGSLHPYYYAEKIWDQLDRLFDEHIGEIRKGRFLDYSTHEIGFGSYGHPIIPIDKAEDFIDAVMPIVNNKDNWKRRK